MFRYLYDMARTTETPRVKRVIIRLTIEEYQALEQLQRERGLRTLSDALRACLPRLRIEPSDAPAEVGPVRPPRKGGRR